MEAIDLGNNEEKTRGVFFLDGRWLALTFSKSRWFRTERGARAWFARQVTP